MNPLRPQTHRNRRLLLRALSLTLLLSVPFAGASGSPGTHGRPSSQEDEDAPREKGVTEELTEDERVVRNHLAEYLSPRNLEFLRDGRVRLDFSFGQENPDHTRIFTPPVQKKSTAKFRWTLPGEEFWFYSGLRVSDKGLMTLNCWFEDHVEAELVYASGTNYGKGHIAAISFVNRSRDALGSNFGSQCRIFSKGRPTNKVSGTPQTVVIYRSGKFKIVVKDGTFEAHRDGRKRASLAYPEKKFSSGKIGFLWGGNIAGTIRSLKITGRVDAEKMAKELRKRLRLRK